MLEARSDILLHAACVIDALLPSLSVLVFTS